MVVYIFVFEGVIVRAVVLKGLGGSESCLALVDT